ncbi:MAG: FlgD immunoglobulin-like domain containing protein [Ignavibacteria bacterium]|jgi:hypothetical protein
MTKSFNFVVFVALLIVLGFVTNFNAQSRVITVEQGVGTLNEAIDGDTTDTGERIEPENTVYVLARDGYYLTNGIISNDGWTLRIKAEDGDGERPIIMPAVYGGGESTYPLRPKGDFYITGIYITNMDNGASLLQRPIRASADSIRLVVDDCQIDFAGQAAFRIDNEWNKIYVTNSIISNIGRMSSPANGRGIDDRSNNIDTLVMENNTMYNLTMTVLRDGGGIINYCKVNHNTILNVAQFGIHFGEAIEVYFTNNLLINPGFLGQFGDEGRSSVSLLALGDDLVNQGVQQTVVIDYNNFYTAPELLAAQPDTVNQVSLFDSTTTALMEQNSTGSNNIEEALTFTDGPDLPTDAITSYYDANVAVENKTDMDDGEGGARFDGETFLGVLEQSPFDFSYPTTAASYTASSNGQPLGALTWFDMEIITSVEQVSQELPEGFELSNNYPNPFNPSTSIEYSLPSEADVLLTIYNSVGQEVATLISEVQPAGVYKATWDGVNNFGATVSSGIYFYQLKAGSFISTKKMILLK